MACADIMQRNVHSPARADDEDITDGFTRPAKRIARFPTAKPDPSNSRDKRYSNLQGAPVLRVLLHERNLPKSSQSVHDCLTGVLPGSCFHGSENTGRSYVRPLLPRVLMAPPRR